MKSFAGCEKPPKLQHEKRGGKPGADLIEERDEKLDHRVEHNIHVWGHKRHCYFLPRLLAPLLGRPRFCFGFFRIVGPAIGGAESKSGEVAVNFSGYSIWKVLINFRR